ncbi:MAG: DUF3775 domain-containing protein [Pseudomonadota bacterium]
MLTLPLSTLAWILAKARAFDVKDVDTAETTADGDADAMGVLEDRVDDPTEQELRSWITDLTDTQAAELVALFWLGRDSGDAEDFPALIDQARAARTTPTADYLLGSPLLADHIEAGLEILGEDVSEIEGLV